MRARGLRLSPKQTREACRWLERWTDWWRRYWRGPAWAPTTYLIVEGLRSCGENAMANDLARRFCRACAKGGMAENFDAKTGTGLRDRAYSWTASVFLLLAP